MKMYIHQQTCISPQQTVGNISLDKLNLSKDGKLVAIEPALDGVPPGMLRRMSKAVRMGMAAGLPILKQNQVDGIIIGTANGGMEDCIKFLNQIVDYEEGMLTPGNFVQSTPNAIAGQLSLVTKNRNYNATHVHLGLAFENALLDAMMQVAENPGASYLAGGVDEISTYNYNIDYLAGWYNQTIESDKLYDTGLPATIAGEGAAMFVMNDDPVGSIACVQDIEILQSGDVEEVKNRFVDFADRQNIKAGETVFISGENGDVRLNPFYIACEEKLPNIPVLRYKHATGEFPTASAFGLWLAGQAFRGQELPASFYKRGILAKNIKAAIIYNQYHGKQHSFIFVTQ